MEGIQKAFNKIEEGVNDHYDLVHVYDKDGRMFGTGSVEKVEGDKTFVRFDGSTVKRFPSDRVKPVKEAVGKINEFVGKELEDRNEPLYDKLVPGSGAAFSIALSILFN